jgi:hypothetical protein
VPIVFTDNSLSQLWDFPECNIPGEFLNYFYSPDQPVTTTPKS